MKVWDPAEIVLTTPRSAISLATDCAIGPRDRLNMTIAVDLDVKPQNKQRFIAKSQFSSFESAASDES